jgi:hypothetical protein
MKYTLQKKAFATLWNFEEYKKQDHDIVYELHASLGEGNRSSICYQGFNSIKKGHQSDDSCCSKTTWYTRRRGDGDFSHQLLLPFGRRGT